jgi:hypothetical protein
MAHELPHEFESDDEVAAWFDDVDLTLYNLEPARDVQIAAHVRLILEEDLAPPASTAAATGETHFELVHS